MESSFAKAPHRKVILPISNQINNIKSEQVGHLTIKHKGRRKYKPKTIPGSMWSKTTPGTRLQDLKRHDEATIDIDADKWQDDITMAIDEFFEDSSPRDGVRRMEPNLTDSSCNRNLGEQLYNFYEAIKTQFGFHRAKNREDSGLPGHSFPEVLPIKLGKNSSSHYWVYVWLVPHKFFRAVLELQNFQLEVLQQGGDLEKV
ncbi:hypothetical protein M9H77_26908 [Catharanthus roseus]|uniref:Uncharacterized protein n=1 Tax=Catharanthus roseus TaxID=4058 RepID=A0ACC0ACW0_CATRO|nr:hypothetical protein M9H77_26908 [Catharanthus roseus]